MKNKNEGFFRNPVFWVVIIIVAAVLFVKLGNDNNIGSKLNTISGGSPLVMKGGGGSSYDSLYFGDSIIMNAKDSITLANGKKVTLSNVASSGYIIVDVDGQTGTIGIYGKEFINGLNIENINKTYYDPDDVGQRWAGLRISGEISPIGAKYYFLNAQIPDASIIIKGHIVKLVNVGSSGDVLVSVDGQTETITNSGTKTVGNILVTNVQSYYNPSYVSKRKAILIIE